MSSTAFNAVQCILFFHPSFLTVLPIGVINGDRKLRLKDLYIQMLPTFCTLNLTLQSQQNPYLQSSEYMSFLLLISTCMNLCIQGPLSFPYSAHLFSSNEKRYSFLSFLFSVNSPCYPLPVWGVHLP